MELTDHFAELRSRNAIVFAISMDDLSDATHLAGRTGFKFPILYNPAGDVVKQYEVFNLLNDNLPTPSTYIIDVDGVIRYKYIARDIADRPSTGTVIQLLDRFNS